VPIKTGNQRPNRRIADQANSVRRDFLQIDSRMALTFSGIALAAGSEEKRRRTTRTARKAYDTIMRLRNDIHLTDAEKGKLDRNLQQLKSELLRLGENF